MLILDKLFLKYEGGQIDPSSPQKKLPSKSPALLGLNFQGIFDRLTLDG